MVNSIGLAAPGVTGDQSAIIQFRFGRTYAANQTNMHDVSFEPVELDRDVAECPLPAVSILFLPRLPKGSLMRHFLDHPAGWMPSRPASIYDETSFWSARFGALLFDHLEIRRGIRGLDVGCGTGFPLIELAHLHGPSSHFTGIDIWSKRSSAREQNSSCTA